MERNRDLIQKRILSIFFPNIIIAFLESVFYLVDTVCIGWFLGSGSLAGSQLAWPVLMAQNALVSFWALGCVTVAGKYLGKHDQRAADSIFTFCFMALTVFSAAAAAAGILLFPQLSALLSSGVADAAIISQMQLYLTPLLAAWPLLAAFNYLGIIIRFDNRPAMILVALSVSNAANFIINYYVLTRTALGISGVAYASIASSFLGLPFYCAYFISKKKMFHFVLPMLSAEQKREIYETGSSGVTVNGLNIIKNLGFNYLFGGIQGGLALAVLSMFQRILYVLGAFAMAGTEVACAYAGILYNEHDWHSLDYILRSVLKWTAAIVAGSSLLLLLCPRLFTGLFGITDGPILSAALGNIRGLALALPFVMANLFYINYSRCLGQLKLSALSAAAKNLVLVIIFTFTAVRLFGLDGLWIGCLAAEAGAFVFTYFVRERFYKSGKIPYGGYFMAASPRKYDENSLDLSIEADTEEAVNISRLTVAFCMDNEMPQQYEYILSAAAEELLMNVVKHGVPARGKGRCRIDFLLVIADGKVIMRIRDDGAMFDPTSDTAEGLGLRLVKGLGGELAYSRILNYNNVTLSLPWPEEIETGRPQLKEPENR